MKEIKLLIIDDDQDVLNGFKKNIYKFSRDNNVKLKTYFANNVDEAKEYLNYYKLDVVIIDLNLNQCTQESTPDNSDGNFAIEEVIKKFRMPIYVVTGEPSKLNDEYKDKNNITLIIRDKKSQLEILKEIKEKLSSKTINYFSRNGYLEKEINDFYWNNLQETINSWEEISKKINSEEEMDKILSRHTISCLNEKLYVNGNKGKFDSFHPAEMYIMPPIKQHYHTGDIIDKDDKLFIILNPACDIVNKGKLEFYLIARIMEVETFQDIKSNIKNDIPYGSLYDSLNKDGKNNFEKYSKNKSQRYHYLPPFNKIKKDYVIDFQDLEKIDIGQTQSEDFLSYLEEREKNILEYERIASISSIFLKDIIARFSSYYARQGQPNLM